MGSSQVKRGVRYRRVHPHEWGRMHVWQRRVDLTNGAMSDVMHGTS